MICYVSSWWLVFNYRNGGYLCWTWPVYSYINTGELSNLFSSSYHVAETSLKVPSASFRNCIVQLLREFLFLRKSISNWSHVYLGRNKKNYDTLSQSGYCYSYLTVLLFYAVCVLLFCLPVSGASIHGPSCVSIKEFFCSTYKLLRFHSR